MKQFFRFMREWSFPKKNDLQAAFHSFSGPKRFMALGLLILSFILTAVLIVQISNRFAVPTPIVGGTITEGMVGVPRYINPVLAVSDTDHDMVMLIYSGLMKRLPDGSVVPDLAERYEISEDKRTYTFYLRPSATFHDGAPVRAQDVFYTIARIQDPVIQSPRRANWSGITARVENDTTIVLTLPKPYSSFLDTATVGILPEHLWKETTPDAFTFFSLNTEPVGSGPFKYNGIEKKRNGIPVAYTLVRFKEYALGAPYIKEIKLKIYGNHGEVATALTDRDIFQAAAVDPESIKTISEDDLQLQSTILPRVFALFLNPSRKSLFADKEIVELIEEALQKNTLVKNAFGEHATVLNGPVPFEPARSQNITAPQRSIEEIQTSFARRGLVKSREGFLVQRGTNNVVTFSLTTANTPELVRVATAIRDTLGQYGIIVDLKVFELSALNQNIIQPRSFEALLFGNVIENEADLYAFWHSSQGNTPGLNIAQYKNARADVLLETILNATDSATLEKNTVLFDQQVTNDRPAIFLYIPHFLYVIDKDVKGVTLGRMSTPSDRFSNVYQWYIETEPVWNIFASNKK